LRQGTAETEAILRRFTKQNLQHPTYKAFAELGKAIKTIFLLAVRVLSTWIWVVSGRHCSPWGYSFG
jgi:hypothetical protein